MLWAILLVVSVFSGTAALLLQRYVQRSITLNPLGLTVVAGSVAALTLSMVVAFRGFDTRWELLPLTNLFLSVVLWTLGNLCLVFALHMTQASQFSVLFTTRALWAITVAIIFLNESLSLFAILGALLLLISSVIAVWEEKLSLKAKSTVYSLGTAFFFGLALANDGIVLSRGYDVLSYFAIAFLGPVIVLVLFSAAARKSALAIIRNRPIAIRVALLAVLFAISAVSLFYAFQTGKAFSILASLNQVQTILVVLGAALFLGERRFLVRRLIAAIISFVGVISIMLG